MEVKVTAIPSMLSLPQTPIILMTDEVTKLPCPILRIKTVHTFVILIRLDFRTQVHHNRGPFEALVDLQLALVIHITLGVLHVPLFLNGQNQFRLLRRVKAVHKPILG